MSIAEFYCDNGIDPGDPDSFDAFLDGAAEGHSDGAWAYAGDRYLEEEGRCDGFGNHQPGPTVGGAKLPGSHGPKWRAVVQGKFRVEVPKRNLAPPQSSGRAQSSKDCFDLFSSAVFRRAVQAHHKAERETPGRTPAQRRATLTFPGVGDKYCKVWYTDEAGVEHRPAWGPRPDSIYMQLPEWFGGWDPHRRRECGQDAEDMFWTAAVLWFGFGTCGTPAYDSRFNAERAGCIGGGGGGGEVAAASVAPAPAAAVAADGGGVTHAQLQAAVDARDYSEVAFLALALNRSQPAAAATTTSSRKRVAGDGAGAAAGTGAAVAPTISKNSPKPAAAEPAAKRARRGRGARHSRGKGGSTNSSHKGGGNKGGGSKGGGSKGGGNRGGGRARGGKRR